VTAAILRWKMDVEKFIVLVKDHQARPSMMPVILNIETDYIASVWVKIAQEMGKRNIITVISVAVLLLLLLLLLLLCLMLKFSYVMFGVGNNVNKEALCWLQIKDSVMCV
jgi:hypothetical protein